ncbi:DUF5667 domain-containing protein [Microbispora sp. NBC_01189]|uniref:DUF5667 domain-containing protein n=1 Tax=Microbispora sp. NBC_01189 TaxID=2903583 RepID=UPI002E1062E8|nr:DUF5667 domain-containing protein [Microbispora sp. NBC_01189]
MAGTVMAWWRPSRRKGGRSAARARRIAARMTALRSRVNGGPSPDFRESLRADLMRAHAAERAAGRHAAPPAAHSGSRRSRPRRSLLVRLRPVLVFGAALAGMFATGVHTYHTVPGQVLYPLKRLAESTVLVLAYDERDRAEREMAAARLRAAEAASLIGEAAPDRRRLIAQALDDMETKTRAALTRVARRDRTDGEARRFARQQHTMVEPMLPKLDGENRDKAAQYLHYIDTFTASGR